MFNKIKSKKLDKTTKFYFSEVLKKYLRNQKNNFIFAP
jgi:hypothetical protein